MATAETIKRMAESLSSKNQTTDPFAIAEDLGIELRYAELGDLNGFYTILHRIPYIVINGDLDRTTATIVCAHELGHDRLHKRYAYSHILNEYEMYRINTKTELEANTFAAHLLISDECIPVLESYNYDMKKTAAMLRTTPELLEIKISQTPDNLFY